MGRVRWRRPKFAATVSRLESQSFKRLGLSLRPRKRWRRAICVQLLRLRSFVRRRLRGRCNFEIELLFDSIRVFAYFFQLSAFRLIFSLPIFIFTRVCVGRHRQKSKYLMLSTCFSAFFRMLASRVEKSATKAVLWFFFFTSCYAIKIMTPYFEPSSRHFSF